ncbi:hypothetical protein [Carbonactinospora thermoautotrophica]|uniref:Uncharacterized protein n=1 Tax=Carbonactinospora thermoautotrophica TaxID=1469144 RepID=A0A132N0N0_9ACTN|nr:hypothetical protein [Carbonactinospora thermoautotrophica]KWX03162.1 hypothetical protein LI90_4213 [Carbonactinospora thermoautotrophica]
MKPKKVVIWILVIFALYTVINSPAKAADLVHSAFNAVAGSAQSIGRFFDALIS